MCCSKLKELDLYRFAFDKSLTSYSISPPYRRSLTINFLLFRSSGITDSGILAIARGCPNLEMINIAYCKDITDHSLISLSKCPRLNTLESRGCPVITSLGLAAITVGCKQLTKLDIKKCSNIDDAGMIPLAHFSQNLRQVLQWYMLSSSSN